MTQLSTSFDDRRLADYLSTGDVRAVAEGLRDDYSRHIRSDHTRDQARKVLAEIKAINQAVRERGSRLSDVQWLYSQYDETLRYHLGDDHATLNGVLDEAHEQEVTKARGDFETLMSRPDSQDFSRNILENACLGTSADSITVSAPAEERDLPSFGLDGVYGQHGGRR